MKMRWTPEGDLVCIVFRKAGQQLKHAGKESTHTPGTLCAIPSGVLNRLAQLTLRKASLNSEWVDKVYPDHANALRKAGIAPPDFPTMGDLWKMQDEKRRMRTKQNLTSQLEPCPLLLEGGVLIRFPNFQGELEVLVSRCLIHRFLELV